MPPASVTHVSFHEQTTEPTEQVCRYNPLAFRHPPTACRCSSPLLTEEALVTGAQPTSSPLRTGKAAPATLQTAQQGWPTAREKRADFSGRSTARKAAGLAYVALPVPPATGERHVDESSRPLPSLGSRLAGRQHGCAFPEQRQLLSRGTCMSGVLPVQCAYSLQR